MSKVPLEELKTLIERHSSNDVIVRVHPLRGNNFDISKALGALLSMVPTTNDFDDVSLTASRVRAPGGPYTEKWAGEYGRLLSRKGLLDRTTNMYAITAKAVTAKYEVIVKETPPKKIPTYRRILPKKEEQIGGYGTTEKERYMGGHLC